MTLTRKAFTLVELLVVVGMIALLMGALTVSVAGAQKRAKIEKARSDVKVISQAILAWENYSKGNELKTNNGWEEADSSSLGFLLGEGESPESGDVPAMLMAQLTSGGKMLDPWRKPYLVRIRKGSIPRPSDLNLATCYYLPNFYRLSAEERK